MTLEERCKKFATRNYINSDGEVVATIVDEEVYNDTLVVAKTVKRETIDKACEWLSENADKYSRSSLTDNDRYLWVDAHIVEDFKKAMEE